MPHAKEVVRPDFVNRPHGAHPAAGVTRLSAIASQAASVPGAREVVLHHFASPPHGAYPDWGLIRDSAGNLYGTTNGSYSDIGGGGTSDAGVVFEVDTFGHETVLYSFTGGGPMAAIPSRYSWPATRPATSSGLRPSVAHRTRASCSKSTRSAMRRCCTASRAGPMAATPTQA